MNITTEITVNGTRKSELAGGLDDGEVSKFAIKPGQYKPNVQSPNDLLDDINSNAFNRGEWISSLKFEGADIVELIINTSIDEFNGDLDAVMTDLMEWGMFCHAETEDLRSVVERVARARREED